MQISAIAQYNYFKGSNNINKKAPVKNPIDNLSPEQKEQCIDLRVFQHHVYEYKKGLRNLVLTTEKLKHKDVIENTLQKEKINYLIHQISDNCINVYFGDKNCIDVVKTFNKRLNKLTPEQDFMLGIMLGYDKEKQCERYMRIKNGEIKLGIPQE